MRTVANAHGLGCCPKCGAALDYGDSDVEADSFWYECWCSDEECGWNGEECYNLHFNTYYESENQNQEVKDGELKSGSKGPTQWDGESN
jgi:hypothetical protein